jgi:hypothetical protein
MRLVVLALLAGCGFEHGSLGGVQPAPDDALIDVPPQVVVDAAVDAKPDATVTACDDDDGDSVCNTVDDWPCGAKPAPPPTTVTFENNSGATETTISMVNYNGMGNLAVGSPTTYYSFTARLQITDTACSSNCRDQLEAGWVDPVTNTGSRFGSCLFDDDVSKQNGLDTTLNFNIRTSTTPKVYDLRVNLGQNYACGASGNNGWWPNGTVPPSTKTIAKVCVH